MNVAVLLSRPPSFPPRQPDAGIPVPPRDVAGAAGRPLAADGDCPDDSDSARSAPYTVSDDLSIFKVVAAYYGVGFRGKIPWSFWQTYKRVTRSARSNSSLYHHWNGAMKKKYEPFLASGRISQCIAWLETAATAEQRPAPLPVPTGAPLCHVRSEPPVPLRLPQPAQAPAARALVRTASHRPEPCCPLVRMPDVMNPCGHQ
jgi:hypothetical protein